MSICNNQHSSNTWGSIHWEIKQHKKLNTRVEKISRLQKIVYICLLLYICRPAFIKINKSIKLVKWLMNIRILHSFKNTVDNSSRCKKTKQSVQEVGLVGNGECVWSKICYARCHIDILLTETFIHSFIHRHSDKHTWCNT